MVRNCNIELNTDKVPAYNVNLFSEVVLQHGGNCLENYVHIFKRNAFFCPP